MIPDDQGVKLVMAFELDDTELLDWAFLHISFYESSFYQFTAI